MAGGLMWFRADLRLHDNAALHHALKQSDEVYCCFCFDREILDRLEDREDRRVEFIRQSVAEVDAGLQKRGARLIVRHGTAREEIPRLAEELGVSAVYANRDYEPKTIDRDADVERRLGASGRELRLFKDQVVFEKDEVLSKAGTPYRIYTQYRNAWRAKLSDEDRQAWPCQRAYRKLGKPSAGVRSDRWLPGDLGFREATAEWPGGSKAARKLFDRFLTGIETYPKERDYPAADATSHLSVHLRFGTVSVRELVSEALDHGSPGAEKWVDELIWREFHKMVLYHFPHIEEHAFRPELDDLAWNRDEGLFEAWCRGMTGYPIVDAGMRQLNDTGFMHNRLRMIAASFLTKDLRIDWKWGERYFARKLLDYDLSQNVGNWQWSASTGTDAQPYFRIFNPESQSARYDPEGEFIRRWVPEVAGFPAELIHAPWKATPVEQRDCGCVVGRDYPAPAVDHAEARKAALALFRRARS